MSAVVEVICWHDLAVGLKFHLSLVLLYLISKMSDGWGKLHEILQGGWKRYPSGSDLSCRLMPSSVPGKSSSELTNLPESSSLSVASMIPSVSCLLRGVIAVEDCAKQKVNHEKKMQML